MVRWLAVYELQMNHESQARELQGEFNDALDALDALIDARIEKALKEREANQWQQPRSDSMAASPLSNPGPLMPPSSTGQSTGKG